jgi:hypothetical protein
MEISWEFWLGCFVAMQRVPHLYITPLLGCSTSETASPANFFCCKPQTHTFQATIQYPVPEFLLHPKFISRESFPINFKAQNMANDHL